MIRRYDTEGYGIAVIQTGDFRFYVHGSSAARLELHSWIQFEGTLLLDHYLWVEFLNRYPDPPDLFYTLRVTRIRRVDIPDRFVHRSASGVSYPTSVGPPDFGPIAELDTMEGQEFATEFYILDFSDYDLEHVEVPFTFC